VHISPVTANYDSIKVTSYHTCDIDNFNIPGYINYNLNSKSKVGGGVCIYIKENIMVKTREDITNDCNSNNIESIFIELIHPKEKNTILGVVYRPPNNMFSDFEENIKCALSKIDKELKECYILGDFNIDLLKHEKCEYSARFLNQMMSSMLLPIISKPT
jgi:exonuclease III